MTDEELQEIADTYGLYTQLDVDNKNNLIDKLENENYKLRQIIDASDLIERENDKIIKQYEIKFKEMYDLIKLMKPYCKQICKNHKVISLNHTCECYWENDCNKCDKWEV